MGSLFNQSDVHNVLERIDKLSPRSQRKWGKMDVAQMLAHCNKSLETAMGMNFIKRLFIGRIIAPFVKAQVLGDRPFGKNSPTDKSYIFTGSYTFEEEKVKVKTSVRKFLEGGASQCTTFPHPFFGKFTPDEWAIFQWKHLDHHLRQFGV